MTFSKPNSEQIIFLKLGGSLLTDKTRPERLRVQLGRDLTRQISNLYHQHPEFRLLLGVGAGSFGHVPALEYDVVRGVPPGDSYYGAAVTADAVARLARQVAAWLLEFKVPAWTVSPGSCWKTKGARIIPNLEASCLRSLLDRGVLPIVHGDVLVDENQGVSIVSTEEIFRHLARQFRPRHVLLAGEVLGVWQEPEIGDIEANIVLEIDQGSLNRHAHSLSGSRGIDITGGMKAKVAQALEIVGDSPETEVLIFDGRAPQALERAVINSTDAFGTRIFNSR